MPRPIPRSGAQSSDHDLGWRAKCQGDWARAMVLALGACTAACEYAPTTTFKVRDPSAALVEVETKEAEIAILPAGSAALDAPLPASAPPYFQDVRPPTSMRRLPGGAIEVYCEPCDEPHQPLVPFDGVFKVGSGEPLQIVHFDWTRKEMKLDLAVVREEAGGNAAFGASVVTPWSNVVSIRRVSTPNRGLGLKMLGGGAIATLLGVFGVVDGAHSHSAASTGFGVGALILALPLIVGGGWYAVAPSRVENLYPGGQGH